ncbi:MAG TPA: phosphatase PAP2 family protein [Steroidobacteraceae bacterium]
MRFRKLLTLSVVAGALTANGAAWSQTTDAPSPSPVESPPAPASDAHRAAIAGLGSDIQAYFTAPLHWDQSDWTWFGGAIAVTALAHHYDTDVRKHFTRNLASVQKNHSDDVKDAIPTAAVFLATWGYASLIDSNDGRSEAWAMFEAAGLGGVSAYALKYTFRREGPDDTSNPNQWFKGGGASFPSFHTTAAFAVGTVLAESGSDDYRWLRRLLGYGLGVATGYERLKHNAHWLSDTVAGAALGSASARFAMNRNYGSGSASSLSLTPVEGGAMLTYRLTLP